MTSLEDETGGELARRFPYGQRKQPSAIDRSLLRSRRRERRLEVSCTGVTDQVDTVNGTEREKHLRHDRPDRAIGDVLLRVLFHEHTENHADGTTVVDPGRLPRYWKAIARNPWRHSVPNLRVV
jgi:hypothetical protein